MPILLHSTVGKAYPVYVDTESTNKVSEGEEISFTLTENQNTHGVINAISKMWKVSNVAGPNDYNIYTVTMIDRYNAHEKKKVTVKAINKYSDDMKVTRFYDNITGSRTAKSYFDEVFKRLKTKDKAYKYKMEQGVPAISWENAGDGDSIEDMFMNGLQRYGLEYEYDAQNKTFILKPYVSKKVGYYISSKVNANNIKIEEDAGEGYTYIRGYGDYDDETKFQEGALQITFEHPLMSVIGKREAPPLKDGRIKKIETMKDRLESIVDSSLKVSLSLDFIYLKKHFPKAIARPGDIVPIREDVTDISQDARIIEVTTKRDINNEIVAQDVVLGDFRRRERHKKEIKNATTFVNALSKNGGLGFNPAKSITNMAEKGNVFASASKQVLQLASAFEVDDTGIQAKDDSNRLKLGTDATIKTSNDGGSTYKTVVDGNGLNTDGLPTASSSKNGLMSSSDKSKLDKMPSELFTDTGWKSLSLTNANTNTGVVNGGFESGYRTITMGPITIKSVRINANAVQNNVQIAQLPIGFMKNYQAFPARSYGYNSPITVEMKTDSTVWCYINKADQSETDERRMIYQEFTWIE